MCLDRIFMEFNTEDFIFEIEAQPAVWNSASEEYSNKNSRRKAWEEVILRFDPHFKEKTTSEKNNVASRFQRKWKSLRDCYSRELLRRKKEKCGIVTRGRKQYTHFDQLNFLEGVVKTTEVSTEDADDVQSSETKEFKVEIDTSTTNVSTRRNRIRRKTSQDGKIFSVLKRKQSTKEPVEAIDEDRLFMLSLVPEFKKVPDAMKLDIKCEIINVFKRARLQQYATPSFDNFGLYSSMTNSSTNQQSQSSSVRPKLRTAVSPAFDESASPSSSHSVASSDCCLDFSDNPAQ